MYIDDSFTLFTVKSEGEEIIVQDGTLCIVAEGVQEGLQVPLFEPFLKGRGVPGLAREVHILQDLQGVFFRTNID